MNHCIRSTMPTDLWSRTQKVFCKNVLASVKHCLEEFKRQDRDVQSIKAIGISNQRETFVVWDKTGKAIIQCRGMAMQAVG